MMNTGFICRIPRFALISLFLAYVLLGWYLSFYNIFWLVGAIVVAGTLALSWKSIVWLEDLLKNSSIIVLTLLSILGLCILLALATTWSTLIPIIVMPLPITFLANMEMRFACFSRTNTILVLAAIASFGLVLGEAIDLLFVSSTGY